MKIIFLLLSILFVLTVQQASACSCSRSDSPCSEAGESKAVFVGKVVGSKEQKTVPDRDEKTYEPTGTTTTFDVGEIYFEIQEAFTGVKKGTRVTIHSGMGGGDCGYWFKRGETYLIYAYGNTEKELGTSICSRTRPIADADEDLPVLRDLARAKARATVTGVIQEEAGLGNYGMNNQSAPLAGVELNLSPLSGKGRIFKAKTDFEGKYEIKGVPAGKYKINIPLPKNTKFVERSKLEVETTGFGCVSQWATIENKNSITGKVIDEMGEPVKEAYIELISADNDFNVRPAKNISSESADLDEKGNFAFTNIPVGRYFLAVNYTYFPNNKEWVYPTFFYPNGKTPFEATPIVIGRAENVKNIVFQLPPKIKQREIRGKVVWTNGESAQIFVTLFDADAGDDAECCDLTNDSGEFSFNGYDGRKYQLLVSNRPVQGSGLVEIKTESPIFTLNQHTPEFKLVVEKPKELIESENDEPPN
jgi:hypothetical protein